MPHCGIQIKKKLEGIQGIGSRVSLILQSEICQKIAKFNRIQVLEVVFCFLAVLL